MSTPVIEAEVVAREGLSSQAPAERILWLEVENARLRARVHWLEGDKKRTDRIIEKLEARVGELLRSIEELRRAAKRQAAPHSKNNPEPDPKRPGRKAGKAYGAKAYRPAPERVDETVTVELPRSCPRCGGKTGFERVEHQWQQDLEVCVHSRRFEVEIGRCRRCHKRVQGRDPRQTSDALGAASSQVGPRAVALGALLNKQMGVPAAKIAALFGYLGLSITPGGVHHLLRRAAKACEPTYQALVEGVRQSSVVAPDETGWRVGGAKAWLWAFVGDGVTVYQIAEGRGYAEAEKVLGAGFSGVLERDGWASYRLFALASHQTCLAHLLRRCRELVDDAVAGQARIPRQVARVLKDALALRDARAAGDIDARLMVPALATLEERTDKLLSGNPTHAPNIKLLNHLARERDALFTFLTIPGVAATNHRAEQALRPAVVNRKAWGGNMTWAGADTQQVLASVLRTSRQQGRDPVDILVPLLVSATPAMADLAIPGRAPPDPAHSRHA